MPMVNTSTPAAFVLFASMSVRAYSVLDTPSVSRNARRLNPGLAPFCSENKTFRVTRMASAIFVSPPRGRSALIPFWRSTRLSYCFRRIMGVALPLNCTTPKRVRFRPMEKASTKPRAKPRSYLFQLSLVL